MNEISLTPRDVGRWFSVSTGGTTHVTIRGSRRYFIEVEDVHFHHDSAVMLADYYVPPSPGVSASDRITGLAVLAACYRHADLHPAQTLLIAGHTDTSGPPDYNVRLSGWRAQNVLYLLTGQKDQWVQSCMAKYKVEDYQQILVWISNKWGWDCDPGAVNNRHDDQTSRGVRNFQTNYNAYYHQSIDVDGVVGEQTWGAFYDMYSAGLCAFMGINDAELQLARSSLNFIRPNDPYVACGENFPIENINHTNYRSPTNRRVELLFFDEHEEPSLTCHQTPSQCSAPNCVLYQREPQHYEPVPIPFTPPVEIVIDQNDDHDIDKSDPATTVSRIGLWDQAFDTTTGNLRNGRNETDNFVGSDSRRIYFRVTDPSQSGTVTLQWHTDHASTGVNDDYPTSRDITLTETAAGSGIFTSRAVMLVADDTDVNQGTDSGLSSGDTGVRNRNQSNHRLRRITCDDTFELDSRIIAHYLPPGSRLGARARAGLFTKDPEERRRLNIHLINVRQRAGGTGVINNARRTRIIEVSRAIYAVCGIVVDFDTIEIDPPASCVGWATRYPASPLASDPSVEGFTMSGSDLVPSSTQEDIMRAVRALPGFNDDHIYLVYVSRIYRNPIPAPSPTAILQRGSRGQAFPDSWVRATCVSRSFCFVAVDNNPTDVTDIHEVTHNTTNLRNRAGGHYVLGASGAGAGPIDSKNLMYRSTNSAAGINSTKRLWNEEARNASQGFTIPAQIDAIRASRYIQPF